TSSIQTPLAKASHLGQVAAGLHITPLASAVFADVQKQPATIISRAFAQTRQVVGRQHLGGRIRDPPKHSIERIFISPFPDTILFANPKPHAAMRYIQLLIERFEIDLARSRVVYDRNAYTVNRAAKRDRALKRRCRFFLAPASVSRERLRFLFAE